jgi:hypothetical protein
MYEKLIALYPELTVADFLPTTGTIALQDNSDGNGVFIAKWEHPTLAKPTDDALGITSPADKEQLA